MIWQILASVVFRGIWKFKFDDAMAAILHFFSIGYSQGRSFASGFFKIADKVQNFLLVFAKLKVNKIGW